MAVAIDGYSAVCSWLLLHPVVTCCCVFWIGTGRLTVYEVELRMASAVVPASRVLSVPKRDRDKSGNSTSGERVAGSSVADGFKCWLLPSLMLLPVVIGKKRFRFHKQSGSHLSGTVLTGYAFVPSCEIARHLQVSGAWGSLAQPKSHPFTHCVVRVLSQVGDQLSRQEARLQVHFCGSPIMAVQSAVQFISCYMT